MNDLVETDFDLADSILGESAKSHKEPKTIDYLPGPVAKRFHLDVQSRAKLLIGVFGTGKTSAGAWDIIDFASDRVLPCLDGVKRSRFVVVRNTYPQLRDTTIKTYLEWFPPEIFGKYNQSTSTYRLAFEEKEIEIIFKALDTPKAVRDLLSLDVTGVHVDEAREIHEDIIRGLLGRRGRYPSKREVGNVDPFITTPQLIMTTNYPSSEHFLYRDFVGDPVPGYSIYIQGQEENQHNLREGYYQDLEKDYATRPDLLRTLVIGGWGVTSRGQRVYPQFYRDTHVADTSLTPAAGTEILRGWDNTGLSPAVSLSYVSNIGQWCIFKEFCFEDMGISEATEAVLLWCQKNIRGCTYKDYTDPAGKIRDSSTQTPVLYMQQVARKYGTYIACNDGIQSLKPRLEAVSNRLTKMINGQPAMLVDPSCTRIIDGFEGGYAYKQIGNMGVYKTEPEKNEYSHIHDSLQYVASRVFGAYESTGKKKDDFRRQYREAYKR